MIAENVNAPLGMYTIFTGRLKAELMTSLGAIKSELMTFGNQGISRINVTSCSVSNV